MSKESNSELLEKAKKITAEIHNDSENTNKELAEIDSEVNEAVSNIDKSCAELDEAEKEAEKRNLFLQVFSLFFL